MSLCGTAVSAATTEKPRAWIAAMPPAEFSQKRRSMLSGCLARLLLTRVPIFPPAPMTLTTILSLMTILSQNLMKR